MSLQEWRVCWLDVVERTGLHVEIELVTNPNPNGETSFFAYGDLLRTLHVPEVEGIES